jgi:flagellar biosynthesis GTPase FlhF
MKKNILALFTGTLFLIPLYGYAEELPVKLATAATTTTTEEIATGTTTASTTPVRTFTTCSQEAIETRDTRIASTRATYNTSMANSLLERKNKEKAAVAIIDEDDKKDAIKASVENYKSQAKAAQSILVQARKLAWQTFENDIKKCRDIQNDETASAQDIATPTATSEQAPMMRKMEKSVEKTEEKETKTIKETIKAQFESFKNLFN